MYLGFLTYYTTVEIINYMNSIDLLLNRQSNPFLTSPAPKEEALDIILKAGMKAPDHGALTPWRFIIAEGKGLDKLSDIFSTAISDKTIDVNKIEKAKKMPYRAPMILIITTNYQKHEKVPEKEQLVAAGCAVHAMQMAAYAQGFGAMWRTGELSYNDIVKQSLNIETHEDIVGYLYIGSIKKELPQKSEKSYQAYTQYL